MGNRQNKLYGSTPTGRTQSYSYYVTQSKVLEKQLHIPCEMVDAQIPEWLKGITLDPKLIPMIREKYVTEIKQVTTGDRQAKIAEIKRRLSQLKEEEARLGRLYITGKMGEETYERLRKEWQEKLRNLEITLANLEREATIHLDDLDAALALLGKIADLYPRLEKKQQTTLLQILVKRRR